MPQEACSTALNLGDPHMKPEPHSPRSRCTSQVSTNHLANGRCPRSAALCRAVCPDDCGRVRESPGGSRNGDGTSEKGGFNGDFSIDGISSIYGC